MLALNNKPLIMGVMNVTPDSFYSQSRVAGIDEALSVAEKMVSNGASWIDVGGEATHPKLDISVPQVSATEELERVVAVIAAIHQRFDVTISVDTSKPQVMLAAIKAGAAMINDQRALTLEGALVMATTLNVPVCLMHMYGLHVRTPNSQPYSKTLNEIKSYLLERVNACMAAGIARKNLIIDPGFGQGNFGKSTEENLFLVKHLREFVATGYPVLVGFSRKTMIGDVIGLPIEERLYGSIGLAVLAAINGAAIIRTHDVAATVQAVTMAMAAYSL